MGIYDIMQIKIPTLPRFSWSSATAVPLIGGRLVY